MNPSKVIYTIGHQPMLDFSVFMESLTKHGIQFVVDVRTQPALPAYGDYCSTILESKLKDSAITYLSFNEEFGIVDTDALKRGVTVYTKVIKTERFIQGIERLNSGVEKGYKIVLLGDDQNPAKCKRYSIIGRYLTSLNWNVCHFVFESAPDDKTGKKVVQRFLTQASLAEYLQRIEELKRERNAKSRSIGQDGEEIAALHLMQNGYTILAKNWNLHRGCELDIVAFKDNILHAVEVKTRTTDVICDPEQAIDNKKLKNIISALSEYKWRNNLHNVDAQIDSIAIVLHKDGNYTLRMYENLIRRIMKTF